jgi:hypothetical protein
MRSYYPIAAALSVPKNPRHKKQYSISSTQLGWVLLSLACLLLTLLLLCYGA